MRHGCEMRPSSGFVASTSRRCSNTAAPGVSINPAWEESPLHIAFMMKSRMRSSLIPCGARSENENQRASHLARTRVNNREYQGIDQPDSHSVGE